jgi:hypothetical protein
LILLSLYLKTAGAQDNEKTVFLIEPSGGLPQYLIKSRQICQWTITLGSLRPWREQQNHGQSFQMQADKRNGSTDKKY